MNPTYLHFALSHRYIKVDEKELGTTVKKACVSCCFQFVVISVVDHSVKFQLAQPSKGIGKNLPPFTLYLDLKVTWSWDQKC